MAAGEKPDFSDNILRLAEGFQHALGHTWLGERVIGMVTGSDSPTYTQLDWFSRNVTVDSGPLNTVGTGSGDPTAGRLPRSWHNAMVIGAPVEVVEGFKDSVSRSGWQEAVAYVSDKAVHVGVKPREPYLFGEVGDQNVGVAMRVGRAALSATMGLWLSSERTYVDFNGVEVVEPILPVSRLATRYPGVALV